MLDIISEYIGQLLLQYIGQSIRWIYFLGKKDFSDLNDDSYNYILSILFYIIRFILYSNILSTLNF